MKPTTVPIVVIAFLCSLFLVFTHSFHDVSNSRLISLDENDLQSSFGFFILKFNKDYKDAREYEFRFQIFKNSMIRANELNLRSKTATFGVTKFSDMTDTEREASLGFIAPTFEQKRLRNKNQINRPLGFEVDANEIPAFDFLKDGLVWPPQDQGSCGMLFSSRIFRIFRPSFNAWT